MWLVRKLMYLVFSHHVACKQALIIAIVPRTWGEQMTGGTEAIVFHNQHIIHARGSILIGQKLQEQF